ncbi:hypothetical protein J422_05968 [Methanocaldococcus villosus KIN24-T80]|uniref:Uncharacterized protein n=1 Tax=Methanocaldococcus villosus KIN24-T80 TaxID=1069083 RepID=N6VXD2_9EURY|nr:DUF515 domain-containing protein [Methanocaldococcus villosus]ENN95782.1 hypothetical protein J422_05968 [Methanocaldococcus villosus KIN24-T80]
MVDPDKIKKLKERSKKSIKSANITHYLLIIIIVIFGVFTVYIVYSNMASQKEKTVPVEIGINLEKQKTSAINSLNQMFSKYPDDPMLGVYRNEILSATSPNEIKDVLNRAAEYIKLKEYKENIKNQIKNICGDFYYQSKYALKMVGEIDKAKTIDEISNIYNKYYPYLYNEIRDFYVNKYITEYSQAQYLRVISDGNERLYSYIEFVDFIKNLDLESLKKLKVYEVKMVYIILPILAKNCGDIPKPGSKVIIYKLSGKNSSKITEGIITKGYIIVPDISYSESSSKSVSLNDNGETESASETKSVTYSLKGINFILHSAVIGKLNYYEVLQKLKNYGYRLNEIEDKTGIFDDKLVYLLELKVPSDKVNNLLGLSDKEVAIAKIK